MGEAEPRQRSDGQPECARVWKIALVPDRRLWAWDQMAHGIQKYAGDNYACDILYPGEIDQDVAKSYDAVLNFSWIEANTRIDCRLVSLLASHGFIYDPWDSTLNKMTPNWRNEDWRGCVASRLSNKWTAEKAFPKFDGFIAVTDELAAAGRKVEDVPPVQYLPAGIDTQVWKEAPPRPPGDTLRVGWCGQFDARKPDPKGVHWILDPLRQRMGSRVEWVINQRPPQAALSPAEMRCWYRSIDVFLVTSISEGAPMTGLEAMSMGRPVISTNVGDMHNVVVTGETGALVERYWGPQTASVVITSIEYWLDRLSNERRLAVDMGSRAADKIRRSRSWEQLAPAWLAFVTKG